MGGIETHLEALCQQLRPVADVRVLAANTANTRVEEERAGVRILRLPPRIWLSTAPLCPSLAREIGRATPDLVHLHLPHPGGMLAVLASAYRGPLVVTYHSDVVRQQWRAAPFHPVLLATLRRAQAIIATSETYARTSPILRRFASSCTVVPYGIPLDRFACPDPRAVRQLRERFGPRVVLAIGRLVYYKGYDVLIEAMPHVEAHLVLVGDGPLLSSLEAQAARLGVTHKVTFAGEIANDALGPYYHAADVFALPSVARSEAFGIVQLEALACGVPVVNTSLPSGVPEVSLDGVTGVTVPPRDARALAAALSRLLDDPQLRANYAVAGRARVARHFTNELMGQRVRRIYEDVLAPPGTRKSADRPLAKTVDEKAV
jgi:rhamnosyl/mannosyltransferase